MTLRFSFFTDSSGLFHTDSSLDWSGNMLGHPTGSLFPVVFIIVYERLFLQRSMDIRAMRRMINVS